MKQDHWGRFLVIIRGENFTFYYLKARRTLIALRWKPVRIKLGEGGATHTKGRLHE